MSGTHTYTEEGSYEYKVTVYDVGGSVTVCSGDVTVPDDKLQVAWDSPPADVPLTEGAAISTIDPSGVVASFTDDNPFAPVATSP